MYLNLFDFLGTVYFQVRLSIEELKKIGVHVSSQTALELLSNYSEASTGTDLASMKRVLLWIQSNTNEPIEISTIFKGPAEQKIRFSKIGSDQIEIRFSVVLLSIPNNEHTSFIQGVAIKVDKTTLSDMIRSVIAGTR